MCGAVCVMACLVVFIKLRLVTDRWTDGRTAGVASRGKKATKPYFVYFVGVDVRNFVRRTKRRKKTTTTNTTKFGRSKPSQVKLQVLARSITPVIDDHSKRHTKVSI